MDKIRIHFTSVFKLNDDFTIANNVLINHNDTRYKDAEVSASVVTARKHCVVTFEAVGYFSDCLCAARIFFMNLMNAVYTDQVHVYTIIHDFLYSFMQIVNKNVQYQSFHKSIAEWVEATAGLEIEAMNDMRLSDAVRVLEPNDHYGNMFRRCPNCRDFEIPEVKKLGKLIKRCPCCGLKLIAWD